MSIGSDLKSSLTGNIETALLVIHDYRDMAAFVKQKEKSAQPETLQAAILKEAQLSRSLMTASQLKGEPPLTYEGSTDRILQVQFNPSQLNLYAMANINYKKDSDTGQSKSIAAEDAKTLTMTVRLLFDDMDTYDSFMWEKFTSGLTAKGISNGINAARTLTGKEKVHSVQWRVESLIAALRNPYTRTISFRWADFSFIGQICAIQANYTMFSTSGRPVRAEVMLRINHEMDTNMLKHWYDNFDTVFSGDSSTLVRKEQNYNSLINLNL